MSRFGAYRLIAETWPIAADDASRRLLMIVFCLDATFAFVFLVALQSYFRPQQVAGQVVAGLALSLYAAGKLALQYPGGKLSDRWGPARSVRLGQAGIAVALLTLLAAPSLPVLVLPGSLVFGLGSALAWPALLSQAGEAPPSLRTSLTAAMTAASGCGVGTALLLSFLLPEHLPFRLAISIALLAVATGLGLSLRSPSEGHSIESGEREAGKLSSILSDRALVSLGCAFFLQSLALAAIVASFRAVGRDVLGVSLHKETVLLLPAGAAFGVAILLAGLLGRLPRRMLLSFALALGGASFLTLSRATNLPVQIGLLAAASLALGVAVPTMTATSLDLVRTAPGALFGFLFMLEGFAHVLGPALAGALSDAHTTLALIGGALVAASLAATQAAWSYRPALEVASDAG